MHGRNTCNLGLVGRTLTLNHKPGLTDPNTWADGVLGANGSIAMTHSLASLARSLDRSDYLVTFWFVRFDPIRCMGAIHVTWDWWDAP